MPARPLGVVGIGPARFQIGPVVGERTTDRDRCVIVAAMLAARQASSQRSCASKEGQDRLVVDCHRNRRLGQRPWSRVCHVTIADLQQPRPVALVAPVPASSLPRASFAPRIRPAPDRRASARAVLLSKTVVAFPSVPLFLVIGSPEVSQTCRGKSYEDDMGRYGDIFARSMGCELHTAP